MLAGTLGIRTCTWGRLQDSESGLYYLRARYYSPTLGRFISRDPTFGSLTNPLPLNRFGYALDNPGLLVDPSGLSANRVTRNGADDNQCFSNAGGALAGNVINAACLNTAMGAQVVVGLAVTPPPPHWEETVVFAKPGRDGHGNIGGGKASADEVLRAALKWLGEGYTEIARGVFRSVDALRQFRMTDADLTDPRQGPHVHFESIDPNSRDIIENSHVGLTSP